MSTRPPPAGGGPKKLTIKMKTKPSLPPTYFETTWQALAEALDAVREKRVANHGHQELYSMVDDLCLHRLGPETYVRLYQNVDEHLKLEIQRLWERFSSLSPPQFLEHFSSTWHDHTEHMKAIRLIFTVLDRSPKCMMQTQVPPARSLWDMGLQIFRKHLEKNSDCLESLIINLLQVIQNERLYGEEMIGENAHHELLRMLSNLGLYSSHFEPRFLAATTEFYQAEALERMTTFSVPDYLIACEKRFNEETTRSIEYLGSSSRKPLRKIVENCLLNSQAQVLIDKGLDQLLDDESRILDLARFYNLLSSASLSNLLLKGFSSYVRAKGLTLVMDEENHDLVGNLLTFKAKIDRMLKEAFQNDEGFQKTNRDAFEYFLNSRDNKPAELIAKYADRALRSTTTTDVDTLLQKTMELFRFLHAKDVFEEFYKQALAKRLLLGTSSSNDLEKMMISILKSECGSNFTNKLEGMFRDMELGKSLASDWHRYQQDLWNRNPSSSPSMLETSVYVLSTGFWPTFSDSPALLPDILINEQEKFKQFYYHKHQGRTLHWVNSLCHCLVRSVLPKGRWDLEVSLFQALVLLQFNQHKSLTLQQLQENTKIQIDELCRTVVSLALAKKEQRILVRTKKGTLPVHSESKDENMDEDSENEESPAVQQDSNAPNNGNTQSKLPHLDDVFQVNLTWSSKRNRLKINQVQIKETKKENEDSHKRVAHDRQYQIDASIVRIMKARKQLSHTLLVTELFKQLQFPAKPQDLKKRIESLIERE